MAAKRLFIHGQTTERPASAFAAVAFSAVISLMQGLYLFNAAATGLAELASGPTAPAALLTGIVTSGVTAFLIIMAMTFGLILPRMLFKRLLPSAP